MIVGMKKTRETLVLTPLRHEVERAEKAREEEVDVRAAASSGVDAWSPPRATAAGAEEHPRTKRQKKNLPHIEVREYSRVAACLKFGRLVDSQNSSACVHRADK